MSIIRKTRIDKKLWIDKRNYRVGIKRVLRRKKLHRLKVSSLSAKINPRNILDNTILCQGDAKIIKFKVPNFFSIETNGQETLTFFSEIFEYITTSKENDKEIFIDSSAVQSVSESTLMYLFAIISDIRSRHFVIGGNHPIKEEVKDKYKKCGFDNVIRTKSVLTKMSFGNGQQMLMRGNKVQTQIVSEVCHFVKRYAHIDTTDLYGALVELMTNTVQHAYAEEDYLEKKWQIFIKNDIDGVKLIFLDTGKGIPGTVRKNKREILRLLFVPLVSLKESKILESAFRGEFRSQTEASNRGKGLPQIDKFMKSDYVGSASVYSGKAMCTIYLGNDGVYADREREIYGTLYECVILRGEKNE